jgi:small redox-active disulfide protein 2
MKDIKVLGPGCPKCSRLEEQTRMAARQLGLDCKIEKITDIQEIISYGIMMTPALVVDGAVKVYGRVPDIEDIKKLIS